MKNNNAVIFDESTVAFKNVDWGRTKELVGKFCAAHSDNFLMKITEYLPGYIHARHVHPEQEETIFVLTGKGYTETESGRVELYPGCISFIPAGVYHATCNPYEETLRVLIVKTPPDKDSIYADGKK